jgi:hypothetical protein
MSQPEEDLIYFRGQAEEKMQEMPDVFASALLQK